MKSVALILQLLLNGFPRAEVGANAHQLNKDVIITVTYDEEQPTEVCIQRFDYADTEWGNPLATYCLTPKNYASDIYVWENARLDMDNFLVLVRYSSGKIVPIYLALIVKD